MKTDEDYLSPEEHEQVFQKLQDNRVFQLSDQELREIDGDYACYKALCQLNWKMDELGNAVLALLEAERDRQVEKRQP